MMLSPIKVVDIELSQPIQTIVGLNGYMKLQGLVRLHGIPIGYIHAPITVDCCEAATIAQLILEQHSEKIIRQLLQNGLAAPEPSKNLQLEDLFDVPPPACTEPLPSVTVAVCTRDRVHDLMVCLDALVRLKYPHLDLLVVDNAPTNDATKQLVQTRYPQVRYVCEPRPGLDWARNRAIMEAKGEIIAYTDDDVVVDPGWVKALATVFAENSEVMAVTGLVVPYELETEAQVLFEKNGGFGRGFERKWYYVTRGDKLPWQLLGTGNFGTGANMAYRRNVFEQIGGFDPALDVGTVTNGAGDLEMFFRVIKEGHALVYEPSAIVRHRHRREYAKLRTQLTNNGAVFSYFACVLLAYPEEWFSCIRVGLIWFGSWHLKRLLNSLINPTSFPRDLILAEIKGCFVGLTRYQKARGIADQIVDTFGSIPLPLPPTKSKLPQSLPKPAEAMAIRTVELTQPIQPITNVNDYFSVRIFGTWDGSVIGYVDISNRYQAISSARLRDALVEQFGLKLLEQAQQLSIKLVTARAMAALTQYCTPMGEGAASAAKLPNHIPVSVVVATYDRPDDLRNCLRYLLAQESSRSIEIVVVDNNPTSGLTPPIVAEFPSVVLVTETRKGLAYARNAGIVASRGDIIVATDDDVTPPHNWLEKLIAPFARPDVMVVTGNTLPLELETVPQQIFEQYGNGGLGRGFKRVEANGTWFSKYSTCAVPTWLLGATANASFRASIFSHPQIGLMEEALGPGMPSGVGEDIYVFYKVLKAGYTIVYEPSAFVWHKHRREMPALRRQLYGYSKGIVSYHLTTLLNDRDYRILKTLAVDMPLWHIWRLKERLQKRSRHPISLSLLEIVGNLAAPWSLWRSHQRVKHEGRSEPCIPVAQRTLASQKSTLQEAHLPATEKSTISDLQQV